MNGENELTASIRDHADRAMDRQILLNQIQMGEFVFVLLLSSIKLENMVARDNISIVVLTSRRLATEFVRMRDAYILARGQ